MGHEHITVVSISGHNDGSSAIPSILKSISELPGSTGLLLSIEKPKGLPNDIFWREIPALNYIQYSIFVIHFLKSYIATEYALVVQDDGWVLNGNNWDDSFLNYDYIGAPCHSAYVGGKVIHNYVWVGNPEAIIIQNGGLSLRSKKILNELGNFAEFYDFSRSSPECNEDVLITGINRKLLEGSDIKIASTKIAKYFSVEFFGPVVHDDIKIDQVFGVHGQIRRLVETNKVKYSLGYTESAAIFREYEIMDYFMNSGYKLIFTDGS